MRERSVLVVDDEPDIRGLLQEILEDEGYSVSVAETAGAARSAVAESVPDLVLLDIWMPDMDGVSLLKSWRAGGSLEFPVIMISGHGTVETAVEATRHGAVDFIEKPVSLARLLLAVEKALADGAPGAGSAGAAARQRRLPLVPSGDAPHAARLRRALGTHSAHAAPLLVTGEPGSGRTLFVQHAHDADAARAGRLIQLRCDALSAGNAMRELYGEESADAVSAGYLESAANGTLLLSDVEHLPAAGQAALLEAIGSGGFARVGGTQRLALRCRLAATARAPLARAVERGAFDAALARRLSEASVALEPLRSHPEDIPALLGAYVDWHVAEEGLRYRRFTVGAQNRLRHHPWPGNLLELKNLVQRALLLGGPTDVEAAEIDRALGIAAGGETTIPLRHDLPLREARSDFERRYLLHCLGAVRGNMGELARHAGMERTHLYRKLRSLEIDLDKVRDEPRAESRADARPGDARAGDAAR